MPYRALIHIHNVIVIVDDLLWCDSVAAVHPPSINWWILCVATHQQGKLLCNGQKQQISHFYRTPMTNDLIELPPYREAASEFGVYSA